MRKIHDIIIEDATKDLEITKHRTTIRAIIYENQKLLMVYSKDFNDYTFPGGGLKKDEDHIDALKRELKEELGANDVYDIIPYGYIEEKRFGLDAHIDEVYLQTSYYYQCKIRDIGSQNLNAREEKHGAEPIFVTLEDAIKTNQEAIRTNHHHKGMQTVLPREIIVLKDIKEHLNEKI